MNAYTLTQYRIDTVKRVPDWAVGVFAVGEQVIRLDRDTVKLSNGRLYKIGESYTKFSGYTEPR